MIIKLWDKTENFYIRYIMFTQAQFKENSCLELNESLRDSFIVKGKFNAKILNGASRVTTLKWGE